MFRSLFNRKDPPAIAEFMNLTIGRSFSVDPIETKLIPADALFEPPKIDLSVVAQGVCDLGEQSFMHRFYPDNDQYILQIQGGDGQEDKRIDEIVLWYVYDVHYLSKSADWEAAQEKIKKAWFDLPTETGSTRFERVWFDHNDGDEDPMTYWESVKETREQPSGHNIYQSAMLYGRGLSDGSDEMLLVNLEQPDDGERAASFLVGRALPQQALVTPE